MEAKPVPLAKAVKYAYSLIYKGARSKNSRLLSFTWGQFRSNIYRDQRFLKLYVDWKNSGFKQLLSPAVVYKDITTVAELSNLDVVTLKEALSIHSFRVLLKPSVTLMHVESRAIQVFETPIEVALETGLQLPEVLACCDGRFKLEEGIEVKWSKDVTIYEKQD